MFITRSGKFAAWFNEKYPGIYRLITAEDVEDMTACGLIGRYRCYSESQDGETIRGILQYEQLKKKSVRESAEDKFEPPKCRMCGQPLPPELEGKKGRPKEYCHGCESSRNSERYHRWQKRKKRLFAKSNAGGV